MIVNLIKTKQMLSYTLPEKVKGQIWINDFDDNDTFRQLLSVEAGDDKWWIKPNKKVSIVSDNVEIKEKISLSVNCIYYLKIEETGEKVILFTEDADNTRQRLSKIVVNEADCFTIGRSEDNKFCYNNGFVSSEHAKLYYDGEGWSIEDLNSKNGTYVNGYRVQSARLLPGDLIYIMGLKIVIGNSFFAINNPDLQLRIKAGSLQNYRRQKKEVNMDLPEIPEKKYFFRSPRFKREIQCEVINIAPPPAAQKMDTVPMTLMLGPSLTMAMTSVSTGILSVTNVMGKGGEIRQALPTLIMSLSMLMGTVLWPILTKRYEKKEKIKNEQRRQDKYFSYLNEVSDQINREIEKQSSILNDIYVNQQECSDRIFNAKPNLWERTSNQSDFLRIRLGIGELDLDADIRYQEKKFTMDDDSLQNAMLALAEKPKKLSNVPISISLRDNIAVGIYGEKNMRNKVLLSMLLQIISLHGYDEVKVIMVTDELDESMWKFTKYLPHIWDDNKNIRYYVHNQDDIKEMSPILERTILAKDEDAKKRHLPHYICIITNNQIRKKFNLLNKFLQEKDVAFSALITGENFNDFPKETRTVIYANGKESLVYDKDDTSGKNIPFVPDNCEEIDFDRLASKLANIELNIGENNFVLPNMMTFLEMFNVGKVEHLNILTRWKENNPTKTLQTPVGVGVDGDIFMLDLHEKYHGPHGLVAGMTGSGKSEFLITYILSLAVNYHPDEVAFILIDYKGGGLTSAFENKDKGVRLPHLAGTITNLDGAAINRSLESIQSELRKRQAIFKNIANQTNEGTMDIYKYQRLYREKTVNEPLPHLFIISDEFGELKTQQPEFMEQLISTARIGRSLGIHLILATQKPSGVVDDQIWSNSKFRVCLKVQEKADSQDMIKCPDAAEIAQTGRFYLQVGFNELFAMGQSAWCGADYIPNDVVEKAVDSSIQVIDSLGKTIISVKPEKKKNIDSKSSQIVTIVKYLSDLAADEGIAEKSLWLEPIPSHIYAEDLEIKYKNESKGINLCPVVGEYDDPFNQRQDVLTIPLSSEGNCLIYGATGNGKTTMITTIISSIIRNHTPNEVNMYLLDYGSETLKSFSYAPHIGGVVTGTEVEKCINLFKMLIQELEKRRNLFSPYGGDYESYCKNSGAIIPNIVVVLNNFAGFAELMEDLQDTFAILTRDCVKYGMYFVVTANSVNAIRYRIQQNFKMILTMQLNDVSEYSSILGKTGGIVPSKYKGRGLIALDKVYEFQTAYCSEEEDLQEYIRKLCRTQREKHSSMAKRIPILPNVVNMDFINGFIAGLEKVPIGVAKNDLSIVTYNLKRRVVMPVIANDMQDMIPFAEELVHVLNSICNTTVIDIGKELTKCEKYIGYINSANIKEVILDMFNEMVKRNNHYKDADMDISVLDEYEEKCYVICGIKQLVDRLDSDLKDKFLTLLIKAQAFYKIHFVILETAMQIKSDEYSEWYRMHILNADGVWIGDGIADQYIFKLNKITRDLYDEVDNNFGYMISKNKPMLIKVLSSEMKGE